MSLRPCADQNGARTLAAMPVDDDKAKARLTAATRASLPRTKSSDGVPTSPARPRALRPAQTEANPFAEDEKTERATRSDLRRVTGESMAVLPRIETGPTEQRTTTAERTQLVPKPVKPRS